MINAGELKNRIRFEKKAMASNGFGGFIESWATLCTIWGRYKQLSGKELIAQQQVNPLITVEIQMRYRPDINTDRRAYYMNNFHNIIEIIDVDNRHTELLLKCEIIHSNQ